MKAILKWMTPVATLGGYFAITVAFFKVYLCDPDHLNGIWWLRADQGQYHRDALAWAAGNLDPNQHFYFPGYALIAAPFVHITPSNPFLIPDIVSLLTTAWLLGRLAMRLAPDRSCLPLLMPWVFFVALAARPLAMVVWVQPWDTTPTVPLCLGALLAAMRFRELPSARRALVAGLMVGLIPAFRPTDAMIYGAASAVYCAAHLLRLPPRRWIGLIAAAALGAVLGATPGTTAYLLSHGLHESGYMMLAHNFGFEPRLFPFQWVTIMVAPKPVLASTPSLLRAFPWIFTGLAGILAGILGARAKGSLHGYLLMGAAVVANIAVYLCFRGLQAGGLFIYDNHHYFKIVSVCSLVLSVALVDGFTRSWQARGACVVALMLACCLLPWRVGFTPDTGASYTMQGRSIFLPHGFGSLDYVVLIRGERHDPAFENDGLVLKINGFEVANRFDYADVFSADGLAVEPLRDLPAGPAEIDVPPSLDLTGQEPPVAAGWLKNTFSDLRTARRFAQNKRQLRRGDAGLMAVGVDQGDAAEAW